MIMNSIVFTKKKIIKIIYCWISVWKILILQGKLKYNLLNNRLALGSEKMVKLL